MEGKPLRITHIPNPLSASGRSSIFACFSVMVLSFFLTCSWDAIASTARFVSPPIQSASSVPSRAPVTTPSLLELLVASLPEPVMTREKISDALLNERFSYTQYKLVDPFVSFIVPVENAPPELPPVEEELEPPPEYTKPLTPLQKMSIGELENGLKAIAWGELGRRAVIEDSAGKGYIVSPGTPVGEKNGVITEIFQDRIVVQQQIWDKKARRWIPNNVVIKLNKQKESR